MPAKKRPLSGRAKELHEAKVARLAAAEAESSQMQEQNPTPSQQLPTLESHVTNTATSEQLNLQLDDMQQNPSTDLFQSGQTQDMAPLAEDIHALLTFTHHLYGKGGHSVLNRTTPHDDLNQPQCSPTRQSWRFSDVLDALANICVSQPQGDVVAIALRPGSGEHADEIVVATNRDVSEATVGHLSSVWDILRAISVHIKSIPAYKDATDSPNHEVKDSRLKELQTQLDIIILQYTFLRIQKRVVSKIQRLQDDALYDVSQQHPIHRVKECVLHLDEFYMRTPSGNLSQRPSTDESWHELRNILRSTSIAIRRFMDYYERFPAARSSSMDRSLITYLRKIKSCIADIEILVRAATSPQCRRIFERSPVIIPLPMEQGATDMMPEDVHQWREALEVALTCYNELPHVSAKRIMDPPVVYNDCFVISTRNHNINGYIHCEMKLLLYLYTSRDSKGPAYSYIGLSKLCCLPCYEFIQTFNEVFGTKFVIKGTHSKVYVPWIFPGDCPQHDRVAEGVYKRLANHVVPWYHGFVPENLPFGPDSTAQSNPSRGGIDLEWSDAETNEIMRRNRARRAMSQETPQ
ncbi:hypothetical protein Plec18170_009755 [Paecilomyces lecythidis]